jgi:hypothetical protein
MNLRQTVRRLSGRDRMAICAAAIATGALLFDLVEVRPLEAQARARREQLAELSRQAPETPPASAVAPRAQLAAFHERLPASSEAGEVAHRLHAQAREAGLRLEEAEYTTQEVPAGGLMRYQILLPVSGSYPQVRRFLIEAMGEMPYVALDGIEFQREDAGSARIAARLRLTAYLRSGT